VVNNIYLLIPLIIYGIYKNGYLIYHKGLINFILVFKPLYLVLVSVIIKVIIDLIKFKKIKFDYNFIYLIIIGMIMPYNINLLFYIVTLTISYILSLIIEKYFKINKVCFIYLIIVLLNIIVNDFTFMSVLEENYEFSFDFLDLLMGRSIGGISSTSVLFSLIAYIILINNFYYKKDIPLAINLSYLGLTLIYFIFTNNSNVLLNSELIFASIFVSTLPEYSPYKEKMQILYGIVIGIFTFIITILFNNVMSIYISTFIASLFLNINFAKKTQNLLLNK